MPWNQETRQSSNQLPDQATSLQTLSDKKSQKPCSGDIATGLKTCLGTAVTAVPRLMEDPSATIDQPRTAGRRQQQGVKGLKRYC